jgi:nitroreductase
MSLDFGRYQKMDVLEAIRSRRSSRRFLDKPVDHTILEKVLSLAAQAPSAINLQPWEFNVVTGEERKRLSRILTKRMLERQISCSPGAKSKLPEFYVDRERSLLNCLSPHLPEGIAFGDFINRGSCDFYGAPVAVIITINDVFSSARLTDIGITVGYLVLAAHALGLATCPIGLIATFSDDIREYLNLGEEKNVVIGIAMGYTDPQAPINLARSERADLKELVKWREG